LRDEIVDLGTRYGIVTPYTSYLALEDAREITQATGGGQPVQRRSMSSGRPGALNAPSSAPSPRVADLVTGAEAVQLSKSTREQKEVARLKDDTRTDAVRRVAGKTFYLIDGVWTDSEFKAESRLPETVLVFGSDEYFALLKQHAKIGSYFSLGERVVVVFEGRVYRVNATAP
jgi:Ca-activated chloride channel homolog